MSENIEGHILNTIQTVAKAVPDTANAIAKINEIKRTTGISKRQSKRMMLECKTYAEIAENFKKLCEGNPGYYYVQRIGNIEMSNLRDILTLAQREFNKEDTIPDVELDKEWLLKFLDTAGQTSEIEKQKILSKVLVGQLKIPDCVSYRTLRILKDLSKKEIDVFKKVLSCSFKYGNAYILIPKGFNSNYLQFADIMQLNECELMDSSAKTLNFTDYTSLTTISDRYLLNIKNTTNHSISLDCYYFTNSGIELALLMEINEAPFENIKELALKCKKEQTTLEMFELIEKQGSILHYKNSNLLDIN